MATTMRTITSLDEVIEMAQAMHAAGQTLYVRYSKGPAVDAKGGNRSRNHATGEIHGGLSVNALTDHEYEPSTDRGWIIQQLAEYSFMVLQGGRGTRCWLLTGTPCGRGADNELVVEDVAAVAYVAPAVVDAASVAYMAVEDRASAIRHMRDRIGFSAFERMPEDEREAAITRRIDAYYGRTSA